MAVVELLKKQEMTISTIESCTGGMLSARLTNVPGVSEVFNTGFVTYSNKAKRKLAGVGKETLKAVSYTHLDVYKRQPYGDARDANKT